jgi:protein-S-isoprenylcysteine O-methyltransferase Ste14
MIVGIILLCAGFLVRVLSIKCLKKNFTFRVSKPQTLVTTGMYKYIRHPMYLGSILMVVGLGMIHALIGVGYLAFIFFLDRAIREDTLNSQMDGFAEYYKSTGCFVPKIRR